MATTPKISQRIALEGAEQIESSLHGLGQAAKRAFGFLQTAAETASQGLASSGGKIAAALGGTAVAAERAGVAMAAVQRSSVLTAGAFAVAGVAATALIKSYLDLAEAAAKFVNEQANAATKAGQTTKNYSQVAGALGQLGLNTATAEQAMKKFGEGSTEVIEKGAEELRKLGVSFAPGTAGLKALSSMVGRLDDAGKSAEKTGKKFNAASKLISAAEAVFDPVTGTLKQNVEAWGNLAEEISKVDKPLERAKFLTERFGEENGRLLAKALSGGKAAFIKEAEDFARITGNLSDEQIKQREEVAADFEKSEKRLASARKAADTESGSTILPALTTFNNLRTEFVVAFGKLEAAFLREGGARFNTTLNELKAIYNFITQPLSESWAQYSRAANQAFDSAVAAARSGIGAIQRFLSEDVPGAWDWVTGKAGSVWERAKAVAAEAMRIIRGETTNDEPGAFQWIASKIKTYVDEALATLETLWNRLKEIIALKNQTTEPGGADLNKAPPAPSQSINPANRADAGPFAGDQEFSARRRDSSAKDIKAALRLAAELKKAEVAAAKAGVMAEAQMARLQKTAAESGQRIITTFDNVRGSVRSIVPATDEANEALSGTKAGFEVIGQDQPKRLGDYISQLKDTGLAAGETYKILKDGSVQVSQSTQDLLNAGKNVGQSFVDASQKVGPAFTEMKALSNSAFTEMQAGPKKVAAVLGAVAPAVQAAGPPLDAFKAKFSGLPTTSDAFKASLSQLSPVIGGAFAAAGPAVDSFKAQFQGLPTTTDAFKAKLTELPPVVSQAFTAPAIDAFKAQFSGLPSTTEQFKSALGTLAPVVDQSLGAAEQDVNNLKSKFGELPGTMHGFVSELSQLPPPIDRAATSATGLGTAFTGGLSGVSGLIEGISSSIGGLIDSISAAIAKLQELASAKAESGAGGFDEAGFEGFRGGGQVWGPGTSTSDSILARLSRGEFVQREKAVRYYGTDFMAALNALRIPKDMFRGFKLGGLADGMNQSLSALMIPRFDMGGLADLAPAASTASGRPFILQVGGRNHPAVISGPSSTISALEREALASQAASTGRKPSWVG